jgi:Protein of unknown function (DUF2961)
MRLTPGAHAAGRVGPAPDPLAPQQHSDRAEARRVVRPVHAAAVPDRDHAAHRAAGQVGIGPHRDPHQRMFWDGDDNPCVRAPLGDFFGVVHGVAKHTTSHSQ